MRRKRHHSGAVRLLASAVAAMLALLSISFGVGTSAGAATSSVGIYTQNATAGADCWATTWGTSQPTTECRSYAAPLQTGLPVDVGTQQDFCMNYGPGAREMNRPNTRDLLSEVGFRAPSATYQKVDQVSGTTCAITGSTSRYGMVLKGSQANGFCVPVNCGIMHLLNWMSPAVRPWAANRSLSFGARLGVLTDNVGWPIPQSVWHGYICAAIQDTSTHQGFLICEEPWRSDRSTDATCAPNATVYGFGVCSDAGGRVTALLAPDTDGGFRDFVGPDPGGYYGMVWTRPEASAQLATSTGASFRGDNAMGTQRYSATVSPAQLRKIIAMFNLSLALDQVHGIALGAAPMSTNLADFALTSLQVGAEGNSINGSQAAQISLTSSGLFATAR